jgi:hypothetical protein
MSGKLSIARSEAHVGAIGEVNPLKDVRTKKGCICTAQSPLSGTQLQGKTPRKRNQILQKLRMNDAGSPDEVQHELDRCPQLLCSCFHLGLHAMYEYDNSTGCEKHPCLEYYGGRHAGMRQQPPAPINLTPPTHTCSLPGPFIRSPSSLTLPLPHAASLMPPPSIQSAPKQS